MPRRPEHRRIGALAGRAVIDHRERERSGTVGPVEHHLEAHGRAVPDEVRRQHLGRMARPRDGGTGTEQRREVGPLQPCARVIRPAAPEAAQPAARPRLVAPLEAGADESQRTVATDPRALSRPFPPDSEARVVADGVNDARVAVGGDLLDDQDVAQRATPGSGPDAGELTVRCRGRIGHDGDAHVARQRYAVDVAIGRGSDRGSDARSMQWRLR